MPATNATEKPVKNTAALAFTTKPVTQGYLWAALGVACFCLTLPITKNISHSFNAFFIAFGRCAIAGIAAGLLLWFYRAPLPAKKHWGLLLCTAQGVVVVFPLLSALAMQTTPASHGGVIAALLPLGTALAATFFTGEKLSIKFWCCAITASCVVMGFMLMRSGHIFIAGDFWLLLSLPFACIAYAAGGQLSKSLPGWQVISWVLVLCLPLSIPLAWLNAPPLNNVQHASWGYLMYLALFSQWLGFFFWNKGLALGGIARISQIQLLQPFGTLVAALVLLGEQIPAAAFVACSFVVLLVYFGRK